MARIQFDIKKTLAAYLGKSIKGCRILDIGCWNGRISLQFAKEASEIVGIDIRRSPEFSGRNVKFFKASVFDLPKHDVGKFDLIICSEVIEHIEDQRAFLTLLHEYLTDEGIIYLTTNNKYWWKEGHYALPFLTYLPKSLQTRYIALFNRQRGGYPVTSLFSYRKLKQMFRECGYDAEFIVPTGLKFPYSIIQYVMKGFMWNFAPGFMVIGKKQS